MSALNRWDSACLLQKPRKSVAKQATSLQRGLVYSRGALG